MIDFQAVKGTFLGYRNVLYLNCDVGGYITVYICPKHSSRKECILVYVN